MARSRREQQDMQQKKFLKHLEDCLDVRLARAMTPVTTKMFKGWMLDDDRFSNSVEKVMAGVIARMRANKLAAAKQEGRETQFWDLEMRAADPARYSEAGIQKRALIELDEEKVPDPDAILVQGP